MGRFISAILGAAVLSVSGFIGILFLAFFSAFISSVILYFLWNFFAPTYFSFLPPVWLALPFWHVVGLTWCLSIIRNIIMPSASASASAKSE